MSDEHIYSGHFEINERLLSTDVLTWASNTELHTYDRNSRFSVDLYVFNPSLLGRLNGYRGLQEQSFSIAGQKCGSISRGPLGHPGDGEFDDWDIINAKLSYFYQFGHLNVLLTGETARGCDATRRVVGELDPVQFKVGFVVPNERLKDYLKLSDSAFGFFQERLRGNP